MRDAELAALRRSQLEAGEPLFQGRAWRVLRRRLPLRGLVRPLQLATVIFHNARKPELNKISMGVLFHRLTILERGVTDLDKQTLAAQTALAETNS